MAESRFNPTKLAPECVHHNDTLIMEKRAKVICLFNLDKEAEDSISKLLV